MSDLNQTHNKETKEEEVILEMEPIKASKDFDSEENKSSKKCATWIDVVFKFILVYVLLIVLIRISAYSGIVEYSYFHAEDLAINASLSVGSALSIPICLVIVQILTMSCSDVKKQTETFTGSLLFTFPVLLFVLIIIIQSEVLKYDFIPNTLEKEHDVQLDYITTVVLSLSGVCSSTSIENILNHRGINFEFVDPILKEESEIKDISLAPYYGFTYETVGIASYVKALDRGMDLMLNSTETTDIKKEWILVLEDDAILHPQAFTLLEQKLIENYKNSPSAIDVIWLDIRAYSPYLTGKFSCCTIGMLYHVSSYEIIKDVLTTKNEFLDNIYKEKKWLPAFDAVMADLCNKKVLECIIYPYATESHRAQF